MRPTRRSPAVNLDTDPRALALYRAATGGWCLDLELAQVFADPLDGFDLRAPASADPGGS
jgi:hypothetical protein